MTDRTIVTYPRIGLLIDGEWIYDRPTLCDVENRSDESMIGHVPQASPEDLQAALAAAERGFQIWRRTPALQPTALLRRAAARERASEIAPVFTLEHGKTVRGISGRDRALGHLPRLGRR